MVAHAIVQVRVRVAERGAAVIVKVECERGGVYSFNIHAEEAVRVYRGQEIQNKSQGEGCDNIYIYTETRKFVPPG
jgi:hypothetical protein